MTKDQLTLREFLDLPRPVQYFIIVWKEKTGRKITETPTITEMEDLHILINRSLHTEERPRDHQFFNHIIIGNEFVIGWEGEQRIDIIAYEVSQGIKRLLALYKP